jgi:hypothetical protein
LPRSDSFLNSTSKTWPRMPTPARCHVRLEGRRPTAPPWKNSHLPPGPGGCGRGCGGITTVSIRISGTTDTDATRRPCRRARRRLEGVCVKRRHHHHHRDGREGWARWTGSGRRVGSSIGRVRHTPPPNRREWVRWTDVALGPPRRESSAAASSRGGDEPRG